MAVRERLLKRYGNSKVFMYMLKIYKWGVSCFWGVKKEMAFHEKVTFSLTNRLVKSGRKNVIRMKKVRCRHSVFTVSGRGNQISIGTGSKIDNVEFEVRGDNNFICIGKNVVLRNSIIAVADSGSYLSIGDDTVIGRGAKVVALESAKIQIGSGCLFSTNVSIMNSDSHSIVDLQDNRRKIVAMDVNIGNHVWMGENVTVLKGSKIQDNVIVGNRSMLMKGHYKCNSIYAGSPAKFIRGGGKLVS